MAGPPEVEVGVQSLLSAHPTVVYCKRAGDSREILRAGAGFEELTALDPTTVDEKVVSWRDDVVHPADRQKLDDIVSPLDGEDTFEGTYRIETEDDETRWVRERGRTVPKADGPPLIEGLLADVTTQHQREARYERYRELVEYVGDPMYVLDDSGYIELVNRELAAFLGRDKEEIEGRHTTEVLSALVVERAEEIISNLLTTDDEQTITWEVEMENAAGETRPVQVRTGLIRDDEGQYRGSAGVIRDISDQRERERELERYETIIQAVGDPVYTLDAEGRFTFVNDAMVRRFGYDVDEIVGEPAATLLSEDTLKRSREHIREMLQNDEKQSAKFEIQPTTKDGEAVPCELQMAILPFEEKFRGTAGVVRDITERKQREERLEQFTSVVSHDLRGPLGSLAARTELARETGDEEHFDAMERSITRMERLIDELLTLARHGAVVGETRRVSLESIAERAWSNLNTGDADLVVRSDRTFAADAERLQEALENLFGNSLEHAVNPETDQPVEIRVGGLDGKTGFFVADDGPGIDPAEREQIFEHGYTTSERGTGFGLSIVERIVTAHDWRLSLTESWAGGARFEILTG